MFAHFSVKMKSALWIKINSSLTLLLHKYFLHIWWREKDGQVSYFPGPKRQEFCQILSTLKSVLRYRSLYLNTLTITAVYRQKDFSLSRDSACMGDDELKQIKMQSDMPGHKQEFKPWSLTCCTAAIQAKIQSLSFQGRKGTKGKGYTILKWIQMKKQEEL